MRIRGVEMTAVFACMTAGCATDLPSDLATDLPSDLPVRERASHPYALTLTSARADLAENIARVRQTHPDRPLRWTAETDAPEDLSAFGLTCVRRTTFGAFDLASVDSGFGKAAQDRLRSAGLQVEAVTPDTLDAWVAATEARYRLTHTINPPAPLGKKAARARFAGNDFLPDAAFTVRDDGAVRAHGSLRQNASAPAMSWDIGWFGAEPTRGVSAHDLNLAVMAEVLAAAREAGAEALYVKYDSTDAQSVAMLAELPVSDTLFTYQTATPDGALGNCLP